MTAARKNTSAMKRRKKRCLLKRPSG